MILDRSYLSSLIRTCGLGRWLYVGDYPDPMRAALTDRGIDVHFGSIQVGPPTSSDGWRPETIYCSSQLEAQTGETLIEHLRWLYRTAQRNVVLELKITEVGGEERNRGWWERTCFDIGFRVHPRSYHLVPYVMREHEGRVITVALEKVPEAAMAAYPMSVLAANRLLHMDMLRETGRRGDARCVRYHMAAEYIRPGDTVLDVACGLGYGSYILYQNSLAKSVLGVDSSEFSIDYAKTNYGVGGGMVQYKAGDAQDLSFLPDNSIDFITAFETVEHIPFPEKYLAELKRVLRPAGRLMICAPNDWTDETGKDPNPHHLHVYTWERLLNECRELFLVEKGFAQVAGGAMKCHHSPRKWKEVPLKPTLSEESEWAVLLCMKDPIEGKCVSYTESVWRIPDLPEFNVSAFARDYENPWLVKGMVAIGMRSHSEANLHSMRERVLKTSAQNSADFGAALCGLVYEKLGSGNVSDDDYLSIISLTREYSGIKNPSPHQLRWQVSLLYAAGELARCVGRAADAEAFYRACSEIDVLPYSPLLGNKTLDALYWLALIALGRGDSASAKDYLLRSTREVRRLTTGTWLNISGDEEYPLPFGFAEMSQLFDKGSRAAYMLAALDGCDTRPGVFASEAKGFFERQLNSKDEELFALRKRVRELADEVVRLDGHARGLARELADKNTNSHVMQHWAFQIRRFLKRR